MVKSGKDKAVRKTDLYLGIDIGSISINTVLINTQKAIIENRYDFCHGKPFHKLLEVLEELLDRHKEDNIVGVALTGTGGKLTSELIGGEYVNEIISQSESVSKLYPKAKTIIEMGGEDSKLIFKTDYDGATYTFELKISGDKLEGTYKGEPASGQVKGARKP